MRESFLFGLMGVLTPHAPPPQSTPRVYLHHIPKTAGTSARLDLTKRLRQKPPVGHTECCVGTAFRVGTAQNATIVTLLREPRAHVLSQFLECKYDEWGKRVTRRTSFPRNGTDASDFRQWLRFFAPATNDDGAQRARAKTKTSNYGCYHPYNMQTRTLVPRCKDTHAFLTLTPADLDAATKNLARIDVVGLTERYTTSICLAVYAATHHLPPDCACHKRSAHKVHHVTHGVPPHNVSAVGEEEKGIIDRLTEYDRHTYEAARQRFRGDVQRVTRETRIDIDC